MSEIDLTNKFTISMGATLVSEEVLGRAEAVSRAKKSVSITVKKLLYNALMKW